MRKKPAYAGFPKGVCLLRQHDSRCEYRDNIGSVIKVDQLMRSGHVARDRCQGQVGRGEMGEGISRIVITEYLFLPGTN